MGGVYGGKPRPVPRIDRPGDARMIFGRYRGQTLRTIPRDYLEWIAHAIRRPVWLCDAVRAYLAEAEQAEARQS